MAPYSKHVCVQTLLKVWVGVYITLQWIQLMTLTYSQRIIPVLLCNTTKYRDKSADIEFHLFSIESY